MEHIDSLRETHLNSFKTAREEHAKIFNQFYDNFHASTLGDPLKHNITEFMVDFADNFPLYVFDKELIVGCNWHWRCVLNEENSLLHRTNEGHFIAHYEDLLKVGIKGLIQKARALKETSDTIAKNKQSFIKVLSALSRFIIRYTDLATELAEKSTEEEDKIRLNLIAQTSRNISENAPKTFREALQLILYAQIFIETEAHSSGISFGRMDQYLYPFYKNDFERGILSKEQALKLIMCFGIKVNEGEDSANITLGGIDANGKDACNELTNLFLQANTYLKMRGPSLSLRVTKNTPKDVWFNAQNLTKTGSGMPAYFNDEKIITGLINIGVDKSVAENYGIVGCYEATPQGSYGNVGALGYHFYDMFDEFLQSNNNFDTFEDFYSNFKNYFVNFYEGKLLPQMKERLKEIESGTSPVASCFLRGPLDTGLLAEEYGSEYSFFGINLLGIGILVDSIYVIKKLVFEEKYTTIEYLYQQSLINFEDEELYNKIKNLSGGFGFDEEESNNLAFDLSSHIGKTILQHKLNDKIIISPALFQFKYDIILNNYHATINGRRQGEFLSYGIMPCRKPHVNPLTFMLNSSAHVNNEYFPDGCPFMINITKKDVDKPDVLNSIINTYFDKGGSHLAVNILDSEILKKAQQNPELYEDIYVKISGYSMKFVTLSKKLQQAAIERAESDTSV